MLYLNEYNSKIKFRCWNGQTPKLPEKLFWQISGKKKIFCQKMPELANNFARNCQKKVKN